jgi:organic radical activating enzyme
MEKQSVKLCAYPWNAAAVRPDGLVLPCCVYNDQQSLNVSNSNVSTPDLRNTADWQLLRNQFMSDNHPRGCESCFKNEDQGITSLREYGFKKFPVPINPQVDRLTMLEVAFSNLCNLACVHCSGYFSTRWQSEDIKQGRSDRRGLINIVENSLDHWDLSHVQYLKIIGGEPMMEQDRFINLLDRIDLPNCKIQICTNGTQKIRPELIDRLRRANAVLIAVSMDGIGNINDWCRWPSKWTDQESHINEYDDLFKNNENVYLHFHHCISVFNVFDLPETIDYVLTTWPDWKIQWDWVDTPSWQNVSVLPQIAKNKVEQQLSKYASQIATDRLCGINPYQDTLNKMKHRSNIDWKTCVQMTQQLARERQLDIYEILPRFAEYI